MTTRIIPLRSRLTLAAARMRFPTRRIWAVFQPHTYSRTQALLDEFAHCFDDADCVLLLDIFAAREKIDLGANSQQVIAHMDHACSAYTGSIEATADYLLEHIDRDDVVITMSAGDGNRVGQLLLAGLREREEQMGE